METGKMINRISNRLRRRSKKAQETIGITGAKGNILDYILVESEKHNVYQKAIEKEFGKKVVKIQGEKWKKGQAVSEQRLKTFFKEVMVLGKIVRLVLTRNGEVGTVAMHLHTISPRIYYF